MKMLVDGSVPPNISATFGSTQGRAIQFHTWRQTCCARFADFKRVRNLNQRGIDYFADT